MTQRIVTFDEATAERLAAHDPELRDGTAVAEALQSDRPSVVILPAADPAEALIARVEPRSAVDDPRLAGRATERYAAGGFLGLSDEPAFDEKKPK